MCTLLSTLIFSLTLGHFIEHLHAQGEVTDSMKAQTGSKSGTLFNGSPTAPDKNTFTTDRALAMKSIVTSMMASNPNNDVSTPEDSAVIPITGSRPDHSGTTPQSPTVTPEMEASTDAEHSTTTEVSALNETEKSTSHDSVVTEKYLTTLPELKTDASETTDQQLTTTLSLSTTAIPEATTLVYVESSTALSEESKVSTLLETTTVHTVTQETTTSIPESTAPPSTSAPTTAEWLHTSTPHYDLEQPGIHIQTTAETTIATTTTQQQASTFNNTIIFTENIDSPPNSEMSEDSTKNKMPIIIIIGIIIAFILVICCVAIVARKHRKKSGKQHFGPMNNRSKKKNQENDVWAGPVKLGGVDCEAGEDGPEQDEERKAEGTEVKLSTFTAAEENGGVGRPGSKEVKKWEETEPLLFIDESRKEETDKEMSEKKVEDISDDGKDSKDVKELRQNGETFCLTTAV